MLDVVVVGPGGLGTQQDGRRGEPGRLDGAADRVQGLAVAGSASARHCGPFGGAEDAGLPLRSVEVGLVLDTDPLGHDARRCVRLQRTSPPVAEGRIVVRAAVLDEGAGRSARAATERGPGDAVALEVRGRCPGGHEDLGRRAPAGGGGLLDDLHRVVVAERSGRVRALALVLVPVSETEDVQTGVDEQHLEDVVGSACQQIRLISGRGAKAHQRLVRLRRINGDRHVGRIRGTAAGTGGQRGAKRERARET